MRSQLAEVSAAAKASTRLREKTKIWHIDACQVQAEIPSTVSKKIIGKYSSPRLFLLSLLLLCALVEQLFLSSGRNGSSRPAADSLVLAVLVALVVLVVLEVHIPPADRTRGFFLLSQ